MLPLHLAYVALNQVLAGLLFVAVTSVAGGQSPSEDGRHPSEAENSGAAHPANQQEPEESKRIFGIIPNYRTSPSLLHYEPLTGEGKLKIAADDSLDRGTVVLAALFGGDGQLTNANPSFGQGVAGFARYFGTSYGDFVIGDAMTEAVFPILLRQDPRYFRNGRGGTWARLGYAMQQIFWTHADSGRMQFNYSEIVGNSVAVAISNAYYTDNRTPSNAVSKLGVQLGVDMAANILKEFWPDLQRTFKHTHKTSPEN